MNIGEFYRPKTEAWTEYQVRTQHLGEDSSFQPVINVGMKDTPYHGYALLAWPFYWWKVDELESREDYDE